MVAETTTTAPALQASSQALHDQVIQPDLVEGGAGRNRNERLVAEHIANALKLPCLPPVKIPDLLCALVALEFSVPASRAYWKGYLKLSFVSFPIAFYSATFAAERVSFRQVNCALVIASSTLSRAKRWIHPTRHGATRSARTSFCWSRTDLERARSERPTAQWNLPSRPRRKGPPMARTTLIQLAWLWLRHQPQSALAL
jgi:hypothetical protein